jgi:UDP-2-acetamido-2,6-beta-L-arabino-hexul-4-ose reductase
VSSEFRQRKDLVNRDKYRVLVTGADGFIGKNIVVRLSELPNIVVITFVRGDEIEMLPNLVAQVDAVIHLAGENRPIEEVAYTQTNWGLTLALCNAIQQEIKMTGRQVPLMLASSIQAELNNAYGLSKLAAEQIVRQLFECTANPAVIFRLPSVFGKWCRPNYNSVVATYCHNIARGLPIIVRDPLVNLRLVYIDDVVTALLNWLKSPYRGLTFGEIKPEYNISIGDLAKKIKSFGACRKSSLQIENVGIGLLRALYATYVSYLPSEDFSYDVPQFVDQRGVFVEMLKTKGSGQVSYFTAHPGITRGGHYHHTKTEKFLVVKGEALFRFRHLLTGEMYELRVTGEKSKIIDSVPGWVHDITNVGDDDLIVILWANENFDPDNPDTLVGEV